MEKYELPLVIFTVLSQLSVGMTLALTFSQWKDNSLIKRNVWLINIAIFSLSGLAALSHLAHPLLAYRALFNLSSAWLSREILCAMIYGCTLVFCFIRHQMRIASSISSLCGITLIFVQGMTYAASAMVAIANGFTMILFFLSVWIFGASVSPIIGLNSNESTLRQSIFCIIILLFTAPLIWLSGNVIMKETAVNWLMSPLFAVCIILMLVCLILTYRNSKSYRLIFALVIVSIFLGRLIFFGETVSAAGNIGSLF